MRLIYFQNRIACGLIIAFWAVAEVGAAEAQSPAQDETSKSSSPVPATSSGPLAMRAPSRPVSGAAVTRSSVSLSPAIAVVKCRLGESNTRTLTLTNQTDQKLAFEMIAQDVVVRDGKRIFVPAGETPGGIAFTAVFSRKEVVVQPLQSSSVNVTFTLPQESPLRAVVAVFRGSTKLSSRGAVKMTASLGTLFTFATSRNSRIETAPLAVTAQSATANLGFSEILENTGSEPVVADGVAAVLNQSGAIVGKALFEAQRLLPGERLPFHTEYSAELKPGHYRVLASFQYDEKVITNSTDFIVP